mgnify:CR=1 FL=1|jgi:HAD superfamily hydrolase (TIGR01509 family)
MISAVLFDMDGVLVDSFNGWLALVNSAANHFGRAPISRDEFLKVYGQSTQLDVELFFPLQSVEEVDGYYETQLGILAENVKLMPGAKKTLEKITSRGIGTAVITNTGGGLARSILGKLELHPQYIVGGDEVVNAKPAPDMLVLACELLGVSTADVVMVGDSRFDVEAAFAAGVNSIGVNGIKGDYSIDSMDDLLFTISKIDGEPHS